MADPQRYNEEQITTGLMALIAWAGNANAAARFLRAEKGLKVAPGTLSNWRDRDLARFDEMREKYAGELEGNLAHEFRDVARLAVEVQRELIEATRKRLKKGEEADPARAAANLMRVAQGSTDKLMTITGRPQEIKETRNLGEILRSLVARGVVQLPPEMTALEAKSDVPPVEGAGSE